MSADREDREEDTNPVGEVSSQAWISTQLVRVLEEEMDLLCVSPGTTSFLSFKIDRCHV